MYKRTDEEGIERSRAFKAAFSRTVDIEFMGVWYVIEACIDPSNQALGIRLIQW